jgi:hypothetical protein
MRRDPGLWQAFIQACTTYRNWLARGAEGDR